MSDQKVTVRIYGRDYTIYGDRPKDEIFKIAFKVDETMNKLAEAADECPFSSLAVLSAVNIADELFAQKAGASEKDLEKEQLEKDILHYTQLWEEAKKNFLQSKQDVAAIQEMKDKVQDKLNQKSIENDALLKSSAEKDDRIRDMESKLDAMSQSLRSREEGNASSEVQIRELEDKYRELEGNYFELQMENIRLKGDLEHYRKSEFDG